MTNIKRPTGLKIVQIHNQVAGAKNTNEEWVLVANTGAQKWNLTGSLITDETPAQSKPHVYHLPERLGNGERWTFDPGETLYLITGVGDDVFIRNPTSGSPQFHFFWNRNAFVWNNSGDRVYLRHANGEFLTEPYPIP